ncbi:MAG TPA: SURF1 family protein [Solimonas sp.]|nr:SURF1 family protein [Solimonas sp.]
MSSWQLKAAWWAWVLVAALCAGLASLGLWQLGRAHAKESLLAAYLEAQSRPATELRGAPPAPGEVRKVVLRGTYLADRQLLLDNQTLHQRPGYHAWTALRRADGALVMVDRGWLPEAADRNRRPAPATPAEPVEIEGYWRDLPRPGLRLGSNSCAGTAWPRTVQYPDAAELACLYPGEKLAAGLLLLNPRAADGFAREWNLASTEVPPSRHYGYAVQWFALALTLLALFLKINLKRIP